MSKKFELPDLNVYGVAGTIAGTAISPCIQAFYRGEQGWIPMIPSGSPWKRNECVLPLIAGAISMASSILIPSKNIKTGLIMFGLTSMINGAVRGLQPTMTPIIPASRYQQQQRNMQ